MVETKIVRNTFEKKEKDETEHYFTSRVGRTKEGSNPPEEETQLISYSN